MFVSHLDSIGSNGDANQSKCVQASKAISRILDDVLDSSTAPIELAGPHTPASTDKDASAALFTPLQPLPLSTTDMVMADLSLPGGYGLGEFGMFNWVDPIDWAGTGSQWSTF